MQKESSKAPLKEASTTADQYRKNVAIVVIKKGRVLLLERIIGQGNWQFPQGGIDPDEETEAAMWRELAEETGIERKHCVIKGRTADYLYYDLPEEFLSRGKSRRFRSFKGQKQIWFLVELLADDSVINLDNALAAKPEFKSWRWVSYWSGVNKDIIFQERSLSPSNAGNLATGNQTRHLESIS
ncbi:MAG: NUDIX domain-containing protein [Gammaproteobacteria bacterium]|nr:NUDIX domain-containing protein [Gammaproteobacteria bacterium]